jgi:hypothetical protein
MGGSAFDTYRGGCGDGSKDETAHCLRFDRDYVYHGYEIGARTLDFSIDVRVSYPADFASGYNGTGILEEVEILRLSPSEQTKVSSNSTVLAKLVGDLVGYTDPPTVTNDYLMVPVPPGEPDPTVPLYNFLSDWMIIPRHMVTIDGSECNKIGVGYTAFRQHGLFGGCRVAQGSCLANQLFDYIQLDGLRVQHGLAPLYNISRYWGGGGGEEVAKQRVVGGMALHLPALGKMTSLVTLEVTADNMTYSVNASPAFIDSAEVCLFGSNSNSTLSSMCGSFEALSGSAWMLVSVSNIGYLPTLYEVSVADCDDEVLSPPAESGAIAPGNSRLFSFPMEVNVDNAGNWTCNVVVKNELTGELAATSKTVEFSTKDTNYIPPPDQSDKDDKDFTGPGAPKTYKSCRQKCHNILDMKCTFMNGCWRRLIESLFAIGSVLAAVGVFILAWRRGWIAGLLKFVFKRGKTKKKSGYANVHGYGNGWNGNYGCNNKQHASPTPTPIVAPINQDELIAAVRVVMNEASSDNDSYSNNTSQKRWREQPKPSVPSNHQYQHHYSQHQPHHHHHHHQQQQQQQQLQKRSSLPE